MATFKKQQVFSDESLIEGSPNGYASVEWSNNLVTERHEPIKEYKSVVEVFGKETPEMARLRESFRKELGSVTTRLQSIFGRERETKDPVALASIVSEKNKALREKMRLIRLSELQTKGSAQEREILRKRQGFDSITASDILFLRTKGTDLTSLLLIPADNLLGSVDSEKIAVKQKFIINFWENKSLSSTTGLGDILPAEVSRVRVTGKDGSVKEGVRWNSPRPGYYFANPKGKMAYIPVFDGDTVEILAKWTLNAQEKSDAEAAITQRFRQIRIREIVRAMQEKGDRWMESFTDLDEDKSLIEEAKIEKENIEKRQKFREKMYGNINNKELFLAYYSDAVNEATKAYGIPPKLILQLFEKESRFNPNATSSIGAYGLGQITPNTLDTINKLIPDGTTSGGPLDKYDPVDQIKATCVYLNYVRNKGTATAGRQYSWAESVVLYHGGPSVNNWNIEAMLMSNPGIAKCFSGEKTAENYIKAARKFYELDGFEGAAWAELPPSTKNLDWNGFEGYPSERSTQGMTYCSRTAYYNGTLFGLDMPRGSSAKESRNLYGNAPSFSRIEEVGSGNNVADVYLSSNTTNGREYWHRALAVRAKHDGNWYVMDPYYAGSSPMPIEQYQSLYASRNGGKIEALYPYKAVGFAGKLLT